MLILLLIFIVLGMAYNAINPLHEATDELRHYRFVRYIAVHGRLPVQGQEACRSQSHHPPLFYGLGALLTSGIETGRDVCYTPPQNPFWAYRYWEVGVDNKNQYLHGPEENFPWQGEALAVRLIRALNVLIGAGVVWLTWRAGRTIWPKKPAMALGAAGLVAFNPMFLYMSASINNDIIAAFSGAAVTLASVRLLADPAGLNRRWGVTFGALYGLALMSKFNLAFVLILIVGVLTWVAWQRRQWRLWLEVNGMMALVTAVLAGWWFLRNYILYGDPTGFRVVTELWGVRNPWDSVGLALHELPYVWTSLWGRFGFGQIPLPDTVYTVLFWVSLASLAGLIVPPLVRRRLPPEWQFQLFLLANVLLVFGVLFVYMLVSPAGPMGRFFFPALAAFALLLFSGLAQLAGGRTADNYQLSIHPDCGNSPSQFTINLLAFLTTTGLLTLAVISLFGYLAPAYARPPSLPVSAVIPNELNARFDHLVTLLGYQVSPTAVHPGQPVDLKLYWQVNAQPPGDYLLFIHLVDNEMGALVSQRDTHPGLGNFPSSQWRPGDRFVESIRVYLPQTAYAPASLTLRLGLYAPGAYRLAIRDADGQDLGDALALANIDVWPWPGAYANAQEQNFNDIVRLVGYELSQRQAQAGETVMVTLYWEALSRQPVEDLVQVRLLAEGGTIWAAADGRLPGEPTWRPGRIIEDRRALTIDPATPPGFYPIEIALVNAISGQRQNILAEDGHWIDNRLLLGQVRVKP
jgi:4-amino-4-deoxy-L-arabinose transferase-like glycosyltransferase